MGRDGRERALAAQQAAEWLDRLSTADRREKKEFVTWLRASPLHVRAVLLALHYEDLLHDLHRTRPVDVEELIRDAQEVVRGHVYPEIEAMMEFDADSSPQHAGLFASARRRIGRRTWAAIAASATVVTVLVLWLVNIGPDKAMMTEAGEWRTVQLEDGSLVQMGPHTRLDVAFGEHHRLIRMSGGEALFEVAKDPARPFVVESQLATARAVGTRFGVSYLSKRDGVVVTVSEGTIAVSSRLRVSPEINLSAGEQMFVDRSTQTGVQQVDAAAELAWAERTLVFDDETVKDAVDQFNRRNRVQIRIDDPRLGSLPIRGKLPVNDPASLASVLMQLKRVAVRRHGQVIEIRSVDSPRTD
jgi:transmembrane sensor